MEEAIEKSEKKERKAVFEAAKQLIAAPDDGDLLNQRNNNLDEEDPTVNVTFRAMTRLAEPSISLICLHRVNNNIYLDPENAKELLDTTIKPDTDLVKKLLGQSVSVQHRTVVQHFSENEPELRWKEWKEVAALKYSVPIVFENGRCKLTGTKYTLVLDRKTGLKIEKED